MIYTLTITLNHRKPLNQRVIQISDSRTFSQLAQIINDLYGFHGEHLREFRDEDKITINHPEYSIPDISTDEFTDQEFDDLQGIALQKSAATYKLSEYFGDHTLIDFTYDFGANRSFEILFTKVDPEGEYNQQGVQTTTSDGSTSYSIISGSWTYLIDDSWWTVQLKEFLDQYVKQKRDADRRETRDDFAERIQPAMMPFAIKNHTHNK